MTLPEAFADLQTWLPQWAPDTEAARNVKRRASSQQDLNAFYQALLPRMEAIIGHLNALPLQTLPPAEQQLLHLALTFMEIAPAVEIYRHPDVPWGFAAERFHILPGAAVHT